MNLIEPNDRKYIPLLRGKLKKKFIAMRFTNFKQEICMKFA